jgi:probable rRNA maturation factor
MREELAGGRDFVCFIADDEELLRLNRQFRKKDYAADVLSFPGEGESLGQIAISADRAAEQARELGHSIEQEVGILMLHGLLHLLGMDHETDEGQMRQAEVEWRRVFELPEGLIERVGT